MLTRNQRLSSLLSRIRNGVRVIYQFFIAPNKNWQYPRKSDVLIYDFVGSEILAPYFKNHSIEIMSVRGEQLNIWCLLLAVFSPSLSLKGKVFQAYQLAYIKVVNPKLVITFIDNNPFFYEISTLCRGTKTAFVQNGYRGLYNDVFGALQKSNTSKVDYMFVFGKAIGKQYSEYLTGRFFSIGSLKNNEKTKVKEKIPNTVIFISGGLIAQDTSPDSMLDINSEKISFRDFHRAERVVLRFLREWCTKNGKRLQICTTNGPGSPEEGFIDGILGDSSYDFIAGRSLGDAYLFIDRAEYVVFIDSTLGYESLARGNRTAAFTCRGYAVPSISRKFGWPLQLPENGPFWTNEMAVEQLQRVMNYLTSMSEDDFAQVSMTYMSEIMEFDPGNTKFKGLIEDIMSSGIN